MNYREVIVEDDKVLADSGTDTFDINILDPITELLLKYTVQNDTAAAPNVPPEKTITKIELVDGGQTYLSMTGREAVAVAAYDKGFWPPHWYCEVASAFQYIAIPLQFGRYIGDPQFAFDPTRLRNPQLKVTWAKDTLHLAGSVRLGILAKIIEGVAAPAQCLLTKQVESWTGATSGVKVVDMFNDYPWRRFFLRGNVEGDTTVMSTIFSHHKLTCDADKLIVFDHDAAEFEEMLRAFFGPFEVRKYDRVAAGSSGKEAHIAGRTVALASAETAGYYCQAWASGTCRYTVRAANFDGLAADARNVQVVIFGDFPHSVYCYQFGDADVPDSWFPAPAFKDIDLKLTEGAAATNSVLVQQPRSLP